MNVNDYVNYYKNISFDDYKWNDVDNLVCAAFAYLPLGQREINGLFLPNKVLKKSNHPAAGLLFEVLDSIRYKGLELWDYVNIVNDETQFGAITIRLNDICYVAFRGTDNSIIGWKEDFELGYDYPVPAQRLARDYLADHIKEDDKVIYVGGHSKGGNLAMASVLEADDDIFKRIRFVYNNDGPGLLENVFNSNEFLRIEKKLKMFLPEESVVGILLNNTNRYQVVKSRENGFKQHDLFSWLCFGGVLVNGKLSVLSVKAKKIFDNWLEKQDLEKRKRLVEGFFGLLKLTGAKNFNELKLSNINKLLSKISIDDLGKKVLKDAISIFIK